MEFWLAVFGWLVMIGYVASMFYRPQWHFSFDERKPQLYELSRWWLMNGYPEWALIAIRTIILFVIHVLFLRMCIRMYTNA